MNQFLYVLMVGCLLILAGCGTPRDRPVRQENVAENQASEMVPAKSSWEMDVNRRIRDDDLGMTLTWNKRKGWWSGDLVVNNLTIDVLIAPRSEEESPQRYLRILRSAVEAIAAPGERYNDFIADNFLGIYNDNWRGDAPLLSRSEFTQRLLLESIVIDDDGDVRIYYDADGMFTDHGIEVSLDNAFQPRSTTLA